MLNFKTYFVFLSVVTSLHISVDSTKINENSRFKRQESGGALFNDDVYDNIAEPVLVEPDLYSSYMGSFLEMPDIGRNEPRKSKQKCLEYMNISGIDIRKRSGNLKVTGLGVIGGRDTLPKEFPHMGAIGWQQKHGPHVFKCGGSLISEKFVLTAAHCRNIKHQDETLVDTRPKIVRLGYYDITEELYDEERLYIDVNIANFISHPHYVFPKKYFDIALIELDKAQQISPKLRPACLWSQSDIKSIGIGTEALVTGWGSRLSEPTENEIVSPILQVAAVNIIDPEKCERLLHCDTKWCGLKHQLCAGKEEGGADTCRGDSGGPLQLGMDNLSPLTDMKMYFIIGVTSFAQTSGCGIKDVPGVYTKVADFVDWIECIVWAD